MRSNKLSYLFSSSASKSVGNGRLDSSDKRCYLTWLLYQSIFESCSRTWKWLGMGWIWVKLGTAMGFGLGIWLIIDVLVGKFVKYLYTSLRPPIRRHIYLPLYYMEKLKKKRFFAHVGQDRGNTLFFNCYQEDLESNGAILLKVVCFLKKKV